MFMNPKRLFDCIDYQLQHMPLADMLAGKENGIWKKYSTQQVKDTVDQLAAGLINIGISANDMSIEGRDKVALLSFNRPEWLMVDMAVQKIGAVLTPIYPTTNINELQFILNDVQAKIIFVSDKALLEKVISIKTAVPSLQHIFTFDVVEEAICWKDILQKTTPESITAITTISQKIKYEDLATIIYTSGTTGTPKGVMLSHKNILSNVINCLDVFNEIGIRGTRALSFLPLNHIFEKMVSYVYLFTGVSIYYAENINIIGDNLREVKPSIFTTVPRLLEKVYESIMAKGAALKGIKRLLFFWALRIGNKFEINTHKGFWYTMQLAIANKLVFSKWREALGGNVKAIITGSAPCQVRLIRIFTAAKIIIMEGYGLTETSPVISVNRYNEKNRAFGTIGPLITGVEVTIAEDGELLCKGDNIMMGYYKHSDLTAEVIIDGWFHTGDIATWVDNKFLKITDRKKEIFKTSGGKYVAPQPIENKIKESRYIEQMMVVGPNRKFTAALIVPAFQNLKDWCIQYNITFTTPEEMIKNEKIIAFYQQIIEKYNQEFNHVEQIKKFELLPHEWTIEAGELTPTLKLKRNVIMDKYAAVVDKIYA